MRRIITALITAFVIAGLAAVTIVSSPSRVIASPVATDETTYAALGRVSSRIRTDA